MVAFLIPYPISWVNTSISSGYSKLNPAAINRLGTTWWLPKKRLYSYDTACGGMHP